MSGVLLRHEGHVVPWVTRWTGEIMEDQLTISRDRQGLVLRYPDGNEDRGEHGELWYREGISRRGKPEWSQVSVYRQRRAMRRCICQVCGVKIDTRPIPWIIPNAEPVFDTGDDYAYTQTPPVCADCVGVAIKMCPHLTTHGYRKVRVLEYSVAGVYGEAIVLRDGKVLRRKGLTMIFDHDYGEGFSWRAVGAKQQVVRLDKYAIDEEVSP